MDPIKIFITTQPAQARADRVLEFSIRANTNSPVEIQKLCAGQPPLDWTSIGPTGFTMFRFCVPELCNFQGFAICLDPDMLVVGDIAELASYAIAGKWVQHPHVQGDCVSVIDCAAVKNIPGWPSIDEIRRSNMRKWDLRPKLDAIRSRTIPGIWNSMDEFKHNETRLIHFTDLSMQPWHPNPDEKYQPHKDPAAVRLWEQWEAACLAGEVA